MLYLILLHSLIYLLIFLDLFVEEHSDFVKLLELKSVVSH